MSRAVYTGIRYYQNTIDTGIGPDQKFCEFVTIPYMGGFKNNGKFGFFGYNISKTVLVVNIIVSRHVSLCPVIAGKIS